ncbi:MAG TPA: hypothetical protein GXX46_10105 [Peptococcaceae bacterium]|nr:hypothetical protein [Peptococcaceae bacterium]
MRKKPFITLILGLCLLITLLTPQNSWSLSKPSAPVNLRVTTASTEEITLTWNSVSGADYYEVFRSTSPSGTYSYLGSTTSRSYTDTDVTANNVYYYKVQAVNDAGSSPYSSYISATATAFNSLEAEAIGSNQIYLSWKTVSGTSSYKIYRATSSSGTYTEIGFTKSTNYTNGGLSNGQTYYYRVDAVSSSGTATSSNIASATARSSLTIPSTRLAGTDRYTTSAKIAQTGWSSSYYAIVVSGDNYPDALCSAPLAARYSAPILLTPKSSLDSRTKSELTRLNVQSVFLIGGTGVISSATEQEIRNLGIEVTRIAGKDRYETSLKIAEALGPSSQAIVATGENFADALSIGPIAAVKGIPILLTPKNNISSGLKQNLQNVERTYVLGGTSVLSNTVFNQLPSGKRLSGANRYETNIKILQEFKSELNLANTYLATGESFPDALAGSALAYQSSAPLILVSNPLNSSTATFLKDNSSSISKLTVLGGTGAVSEAVLNSAAGISNTSISAPAAPTNLTATATDTDEISLSWSSVSGATSYTIYRATSSSGTYSNIATVNSTSYKNTGLTANTTYYYKIRAVNSAGQSPDSSSVSATTFSNAAPSIPTNLEANPLSSSQIELTWSAASRATSYEIYRSTSYSGTYSKIATVSTTYYTNSGLSAGTTYYYQIRAINSAGPSSFTSIVSATTLAKNVPAAPQNLTATALSPSEISLTWSAVNSANSYTIYRSTTSNGSYSVIKTVTTNSYTDTGLTENTTYYYRVKASNSAGSSDYSSTVNATTLAGNVPPAPQNLSVTVLNSTSISLTWSETVGATSYEIHTSSNLEGTYTRLVTVSSPAYTHTGLKANQTFYYKIRAINSNGAGSFSEAVHATTPPSVPNGLKATADSSSQISLSWSPVDGAETYTIFRSTSAEGQYIELATILAPPYADTGAGLEPNTGLAPGTTYYYKVRANGAGGSSDLSSPVAATTLTDN